MTTQHQRPVIIGSSAAGRVPDHVQQLPDWRSVLVVIAHPDDESFGLGAIIHQITQAGAAAHVVCFTHGEASTLNETGADLHAARCQELALASSELGIVTVDLHDYGDGQLGAVSTGELAARVLPAIRQYNPGGLLVFDDTGITGHPDHRAATAAALEAARPRALPVLAWTLPGHVASQLRRETGQPFAGQPPDRIHISVQVTRHAQHRASLAHASQISPSAVLWRRLQLLGDHEHLRWLAPPS
jgi:N-acetylglucosamine malate deacetylase 2